MRIILVRHGKPALGDSGWCAPADMGHWVARYNRADVLTGSTSRALAHYAGAPGTCVVSSSLSRCIQSAGLLPGQPAPCTGDPVFAEAHLPYPDWRRPRLPARVWRLAFRAAWFLGFARHSEPIAASRQRAGVAAERLIALAETHGTVLLVGHGIMNILIASQLRKRGWRGPWLLFLRTYWHLSVYRKRTPAGTLARPVKIG